MTCNYIKELVEKESGVPDLGVKSRKRYLADCRIIYFELCRKYLDINPTLSMIGEPVNRHHSTVVNGLNSFDIHYGKPWFTATKIYDKCVAILNDPLDNPQTLKEWMQENNMPEDVVLKWLKKKMANKIEVKCEIIKK